MVVLEMLSTAETPEILLDQSKGLIRIKGRSLAQNSVEFFRPITLWIIGYFKEPQPHTTIELDLEYFNSTANKLIKDLMVRIKNITPDGSTVSVNWFYDEDDEDILQQGKEIEQFSGIEFNYIPKG